MTPRQREVLEEVRKTFVTSPEVDAAFDLVEGPEPLDRWFMLEDTWYDLAKPYLDPGLIVNDYIVNRDRFLEASEHIVGAIIATDYLAPLTIRELQAEAHATARSKGFWSGYNTSYPDAANTPKYLLSPDETAAKLALIHSEVSEALECVRNNDRASLSSEMADIVIRVMDLCGGLHIDLETAMVTKMATNKTRPYLHGGKAL